MPADPFQVLESFVSSVRNLTSDDNYKAVASVFEEIPKLKGQVESKDSELARLRKEIVSLKAGHESRRQEDLELYRKQHNKINQEKTDLSGKISALTAHIQQKDDALAELNKKQEGFRGQLDLAKKSLRQETDRVAAANAAITKLQQSLKAKDTEIDKLKEDLHNKETQASSTGTQLLTLQKEKASLEQTLQSKTTRLSEVEGYATTLVELDGSTWVNQLDRLWEIARHLVESHFTQDLTEASLEGLVKNLKGSQFLDRPIPLPRSNSPAAKRMRTAAMLAILARNINSYIFQPTYILEEDEEIRLLLVRLAVTNSKKESFCRALLLSIDPEQQTKEASKRVGRVVREVAWYVQDMLSVAQYESFRSGLEQVVKQACEFWRTVQCSPEKYEPYFDLNHYDDVEWQPLRFEDGEQGSTRARDGDEELLVIFPRIYIIEDEEPEPITNGVVLTKSQSKSAAEEEEVERRKPSSPTVGKTMPRSRSNKTRNKSISLNGGSGFLSQTPSGAQ